MARLQRDDVIEEGKGASVKMTWELLNVEIAKDPGRTGFYILHLGKRRHHEVQANLHRIPDQTGGVRKKGYRKWRNA